MSSKGHNQGGRVSVYDPTLSPTWLSSLWKTCPLAERIHDGKIGVLLDEQFVDYDVTDDYVATAATSGTAAISTASPGSLLLDAGATTDNQGIQIQRTKAGFIPAAGKSLWFEAKVNLSATTPPVTRAQLFIGLAAADTTIIASGAMSTQNRLGFQILDGGLLVSTFTADKAGVHTEPTGCTFVPATDVDLGFFYDGDADTVQPYVNGVAVGTPIATANIPKVVLYPSFVCQSDATDRPNLLIKGYRVFQLR